MSMFLRSLYHVVLESLHLSALVVIKKQNVAVVAVMLFFFYLYRVGQKKPDCFSDLITL